MANLYRLSACLFALSSFNAFAVDTDALLFNGLKIWT